MQKPIIIASLILTIVTPKATAALIEYKTLIDSSSLTLNGAAQISDSNLRLTKDDGETGTAFCSDPLSIHQLGGFSTWLQFQVTAGQGNDDVAGGLAFVLQSMGPRALGRGDGGLGYEGISPSIAVKFDISRNLWDPGDNHVGINLNGSIISHAKWNLPTPFNHGQIWNAWIHLDLLFDYLEISVSERLPKPANPQFTYLLRLDDLFVASDELFVGFTAASCGADAVHEILAWRFDCNPNPVPLPGTFWILLPAAVLKIIFRKLHNLYTFFFAADSRRHSVRPTWPDLSLHRFAIEYLP